MTGHPRADLRRFAYMSMNELVPIGQAARMLGVSVATMRRWDAAGVIRSVRTPTGHRRFLVSDLSKLATPPNE